MSDHNDDPLLGLLTDIAEGVAVLVARVDAMDAKIAVQYDLTNEALATIAEIATRTYYASKPPSPLPDDIINASVMDSMIERWPKDAQVTFPPPEFETLSGVATLRTRPMPCAFDAHGHWRCLVKKWISGRRPTDRALSAKIGGGGGDVIGSTNPAIKKRRHNAWATFHEAALGVLQRLLAKLPLPRSAIHPLQSRIYQIEKASCLPPLTRQLLLWCG
jgi:hypothetical protein